MAISYRTIYNANIIELHYWLKDDSHLMDAYVQNKCEYEFLKLIKDVALSFDVSITIETEPLANGGIRRYFKVLQKKEKRDAGITIAVITAIVTTILVTPLATGITKITEKAIEKFFEDEELSALAKDKLKEEVRNLRLDADLKQQQLDQSSAIVKHRSNFYEALEKEPKVYQLSVSVENDQKAKVFEEKFISKGEFTNFILVSNKLKPEIVEDAVIEIISPVLKKGDYKWRGIYNGEIISFNMRSSEFKKLVQTGKIEFKNGSTIICPLEVERIIDNDGSIKIIEYNIYRVDKYFENNDPIETPEGKRHKQQIAAGKSQLKFPFENPEFE